MSQRDKPRLALNNITAGCLSETGSIPLLFLSPLDPKSIPRIPRSIEVAVNVPEVDAEIRLVVFWIIGHFSHERLQMLFGIIEFMHKQRPFSVIILFGNHGG